MTCSHVLGLIDAGPFADYPRTHLDAAWKHADGCPSCGRARDTSLALAKGLRHLEGPAAPLELTGAVMARIARFDEQHEPIAGTRPASSGRAWGRADWEAWMPAAGALQATVAVAIAMALSGTTAEEPGTSASGAEWVSIAASRSSLALLASLMLYVAALHAPLRRHRSDDETLTREA